MSLCLKATKPIVVIQHVLTVQTNDCVMPTAIFRTMWLQTKIAILVEDGPEDDGTDKPQKH